MLFDPVILLAGGSVVLIAALEKTAVSYGFYWIGTITKLILPLTALIAGVYFIETNPILGWLK